MASKGKGARDKGAAFERLIVRQLKEAFADQPWAEGIRRGKQSHTADECDVVGVPGLWLELQHADRVTPLAKLEQAIGDEHRAGGHRRLCAAITRRTGAISIRVTMRLGDLDELRGGINLAPVVEHPVTLSLADFIALYRAHRCS